MYGNTNLREINKYEYTVNVRNTSYISDKNGICSIEQNNLDDLTPVSVTDGGGVHII